MSYDFTCEYAKSNRSSCKHCRDKISKGELRLARMVQSPHFDGKIPQWNHKTCFFIKSFRGMTRLDMLHGIDNIQQEDIDWISSQIDKKGGNKAKKEVKPKTKEELEMEAALKKQNELLWSVKKPLNDIPTNILKELLEANSLSSRGGRDTLIQHLVDAMVFGVPEPCPDCGGRLVFSTSKSLMRCTQKTEWGQCLFEKPCEDVVMNEFSHGSFEGYDMTDSEESEVEEEEEEEEEAEAETTSRKRKRPKKKAKKSKRRKRSKAAQADHETAKLLMSLDKPIPRVVRQKKVISEEERKTTLLAGLAFYLLDNDDALKKIIEDAGGEVKTRLTKNTVTHVIASETDDDDKIDRAIEHGIPIVNAEFIHESIKAVSVQDVKAYRVDDEGVDEANEFKERGKKKKKMVIKGHSAVDPECPYADDYHVVEKNVNGELVIYDVMLNVVDLINNKSSYYGMQILQGDKTNDFMIWRKWGRVATTIGGNKLEEFYSFSDAFQNFQEVYYDKTGNHWENRDHFEKRPGKFFPVEISYEDDSDSKKMHQLKKDNRSKLPDRVQDLMCLIFDLKLMEAQLKEMEIDLKKMPLGKLTKRHIKSAFEVLNEISAVLDGTSDDNRNPAQVLLELSNKFYTIIPHDFGSGDVKIIDNDDFLKEKIKMVEALVDVNIATNVLSEENKKAGEPEVDQKYRMLKTKLEPLDTAGEEWDLMNKYVKGGRSVDWHNYNQLQLVDAFKVSREGESGRFDLKKNLGNRRMLWHGSRIMNYGGILSQGLRIAPPEAPKSGYRFGKGVYFADMIGKSVMYCRSSGSEEILIMVCDVALGSEFQTHKDVYMEKPRAGTNSTHAMGRFIPNPSGDTTLSDGEVIPLGKPLKKSYSSSVNVNEFIVYDISQVQIRYLLKLRIDGKGIVPPPGIFTGPSLALEDKTEVEEEKKEEAKVEVEEESDEEEEIEEEIEVEEPLSDIEDLETEMVEEGGAEEEEEGATTRRRSKRSRAKKKKTTPVMTFGENNVCFLHANAIAKEKYIACEGPVANRMGKKVDVLVVESGNEDFGSKGKTAAKYGIPIVLDEWVFQSIKQKKELDVDAFDIKHSVSTRRKLLKAMGIEQSDLVRKTKIIKKTVKKTVKRTRKSKNVEAETAPAEIKHVVDDPTPLFNFTQNSNPTFSAFSATKKDIEFKLLDTKRFGRSKLEICQGSVVEAEGDAVVHPTNETMNLGGYVGQALRVAGGVSFENEVQNSETRLEVAGCSSTGAGGLKNKVVIHVNTPRYADYSQARAQELLETCVRNVMEEAETQGCISLVLPALASGMNGYPKPEACEIILNEVAKFLAARADGMEDYQPPSQIEGEEDMGEEGIEGENMETEEDMGEDMGEDMETEEGLETEDMGEEGLPEGAGEIMPEEDRQKVFRRALDVQFCIYDNVLIDIYCKQLDQLNPLEFEGFGEMEGDDNGEEEVSEEMMEV
eukprot:TRINITY_DN242_c1_g1_i1.p1 TRINITY_DN242_c1_g1~~TRINITY_DN242_c1_g1_i1.p1  ORF type:complete len:1451 (+),score=678.48 TRINITY_DN242_c1_g1_i1:158-4510(+)